MKYLIKLLLILMVTPLLGIDKKLTLPDFNQGIGQGDPYFHEFFEKWRAFPKIRYEFWGNMPSRNPWFSDFFKFCKRKYEAIRLQASNKNFRIPCIIHQIWLGSEFPEKYKKWQKTWQSIPGWKYILWTDKDIEAFGLENKKLYEESKNYGQRSDIARIEILNRLGGLYVDVDFECINGSVFTQLNEALEFYAGMEPLDMKYFWISNALIASKPNHPILKGYIKELKLRFLEAKTNPVFRSGPIFFTAMCWTYSLKNSRDCFLPSLMCFPLGYFQAKKLQDYTHEEIKKIVSKEYTAAIHWWAGSWTLPTARVQ